MRCKESKIKFEVLKKFEKSTHIFLKLPPNCQCHSQTTNCVIVPLNFQKCRRPLMKKNNLHKIIK